MSFIDNIKKGFWLGIGFSLSNNTTNKLLHTIPKLYNNVNEHACENILKDYDNCVKYEKNSNCREIFKDFENCRKFYTRL
jgi:hypothetical protein